MNSSSRHLDLRLFFLSFKNCLSSYYKKLCLRKSQSEGASSPAGNRKRTSSGGNELSRHRRSPAEVATPHRSVSQACSLLLYGQDSSVPSPHWGCHKTEMAGHRFELETRDLNRVVRHAGFFCKRTSTLPSSNRQQLCKRTRFCP